MNERTCPVKTLGIALLTGILVLAAAALLFLVWPRPMAAAQVTASPGDPVLTPDGRLPDVPIVFVSRNRLATLDNVHVGPPLDVSGRERTPRWPAPGLAARWP